MEGIGNSFVAEAGVLDGTVTFYRSNPLNDLQLYVRNSGRTEGLGSPIGFLKVSTNAAKGVNGVMLYILPYNFPKLFKLIEHVIKNPIIKASPPQAWIKELRMYFADTPSYYHQKLKTMLKKIGVERLIPESTILSMDGWPISMYLTSVHNQAHAEYVNFTSAVARKKSEDSSNGQLPTAQSIAEAKAAKNAFDVPLESMMTELNMLLSFFDTYASSGTKISKVSRSQDHEDMLHSLPTSVATNHNIKLPHILLRNPFESDSEMQLRSKRDPFGNPWAVLKSIGNKDSQLSTAAEAEAEAAAGTDDEIMNEASVMLKDANVLVKPMKQDTKKRGRGRKQIVHSRRSRSLAEIDDGLSESGDSVAVSFLEEKILQLPVKNFPMVVIPPACSFADVVTGNIDMSQWVDNALKLIDKNQSEIEVVSTHLNETVRMHVANWSQNLLRDTAAEGTVNVFSNVMTPQTPQISDLQSPTDSNRTSPVPNSDSNWSSVENTLKSVLFANQSNLGKHESEREAEESSRKHLKLDNFQFDATFPFDAALSSLLKLPKAEYNESQLIDEVLKKQPHSLAVIEGIPQLFSNSWNQEKIGVTTSHNATPAVSSMLSNFQPVNQPLTLNEDLVLGNNQNSIVQELLSGFLQPYGTASQADISSQHSFSQQEMQLLQQFQGAPTSINLPLPGSFSGIPAGVPNEMQAMSGLQTSMNQSNLVDEDAVSSQSQNFTEGSHQRNANNGASENWHRNPKPFRPQGINHQHPTHRGPPNHHQYQHHHQNSSHIRQARPPQNVVNAVARGKPVVLPSNMAAWSQNIMPKLKATKSGFAPNGQRYSFNKVCMLYNLGQPCNDNTCKFEHACAVCASAGQAFQGHPAFSHHKEYTFTKI
ncbi:hypothetical protein HDU83_006906 [Entophlyctis luteolus]|nr:hypothetical protein HDU83_006906 [Entophlyctis luteolus]